MPVLCARLLIDCSTLSAPCLEAELRLIHRSRAKSRRVRRSSSESGSGLNVHEELRSHHLERRGGREWRFVASIWWMRSLIACEVLPENPWVKEKMLAKTWGVRPGLRSDNGAARRGLPTL